MSSMCRKFQKINVDEKIFKMKYSVTFVNYICNKCKFHNYPEYSLKVGVQLNTASYYRI